MKDLPLAFSFVVVDLYLSSIEAIQPIYNGLVLCILAVILAMENNQYVLTTMMTSLYKISLVLLITHYNKDSIVMGGLVLLSGSIVNAFSQHKKYFLSFIREELEVEVEEEEEKDVEKLVKSMSNIASEILKARKNTKSNKMSELFKNMDWEKIINREKDKSSKDVMTQMKEVVNGNNTKEVDEDKCKEIEKNVTPAGEEYVTDMVDTVFSILGQVRDKQPEPEKEKKQKEIFNRLCKMIVGVKDNDDIDAVQTFGLNIISDLMNKEEKEKDETAQ